MPPKKIVIDERLKDDLASDLWDKLKAEFVKGAKKIKLSPKQWSQFSTNLIDNKKIKLGDEQMKALAQVVAPSIKVNIDYEKIINAIPKPKDGKDLVLTEALKTEHIEAILRMIPKPKDGEDYALTPQDRADIADIVKRQIPEPKDGKDAKITEEFSSKIIDYIINEAELATRSEINNKIEKLIESIKRIQKSSGGGISDGDMVAAINQALGGDSWQTGGGALRVGEMEGFWARWLSLTSVSYESGFCQANGKDYYLSVDTTYNLTGVDFGFHLEYIYIDDSASTPPTPTFINSSTAPMWDGVRRGWYNGNDRMVSCHISPNAVAGIEYFDTYKLGEKLISVTADRYTMESNRNPDGNWQIPLIDEGDTYLPVNAAQVRIALYNTNMGDVVLGWDTKETVDAGFAVGDSSNSEIYNNKALITQWGSVGPSRKFRIFGNNDADNSFGFWMIGFRYTR